MRDQNAQQKPETVPVVLRVEELETLRNIVGESSDPEDVFPGDRLGEWATDNGYVHKDTLAQWARERMQGYDHHNARRRP